LAITGAAAPGLGIALGALLLIGGLIAIARRRAQRR
jgi:LPXTG-motif cell wall-anchored protein